MKLHFFRYFYPTIIWAVIIITLSVLPGDDMESLWFDFIIDPDKIVHFGFYFILSFLILRSYRRYTINNPKAFIIILYALGIVFALGSILEIVQMIDVLKRSADYVDVIFNLAGGLFGVFFYYFCRQFKLFKRLI